ncbi:F-box protein PP2-B13-like [Cucumis melo var. makuwa]|uniref:F-box protein PP2-B13-like n=1 Tax=Cucumis melo var. makuwa TaxID=1194695 RepID=A0A5D3BDF0_CUCMM|nr:F-box protein PP2-B13-like [Cucumis melo var. makuwa]
MVAISSIGVLPEDCVSAILSLTTPSDAGKLALVSSMFRSAAESDVVWGRFLPENYEEIVAASEISGEAPLSSKREAFFRLCSPILVEEGKKSFELEKLSGKIIYMLSARELGITWSSDPLCWSWKSHPQSKFPEVVELRTVSWLEIKGEIRTKMLSPNTKYGAYLLFNISERAYGLDLMPTQLSLQLLPNNQPNNCNDNNSESYVWLHRKHKHHEKNQSLESLLYGNRRERASKLLQNHLENKEFRVLSEREDGWLEIELGEFFTTQKDEQVHMSFMETKGFQLKSGLLIQGIQIRPKH